MISSPEQRKDSQSLIRLPCARKENCDLFIAQEPVPAAFPEAAVLFDLTKPALYWLKEFPLERTKELGFIFGLIRLPMIELGQCQ